MSQLVTWDHACWMPHLDLASNKQILHNGAVVLIEACVVQPDAES